MRIKSLLMLVCVLALPLAMVNAQGGTIGSNEVVEGSVSNSQAEYALTLEAGQVVSILLQSEEFDTYLEVLDNAGETLASDDDSGGSLNSALLFTAPIAGTYTVLVRSYSGDATGAYTLTTSESEVIALSFEASAKALFDGETARLYFSFTGKEGDVVNLYTDNPDLDLRIWLYAPDGTELAYDDDSGDGYAPFVRRAYLPASGEYRVELAPFSEDASGVANLILEATELPMLDAGPQTVELNSELSTENFGMTVEEGAAYRVVVTSDVAANGNVEIMLDAEMYDVVSLNFNNTTEVSAVFTSSVSGLVNMALNNYSWSSDSVVFTVSIAPAQ